MSRKILVSTLRFVFGPNLKKDIENLTIEWITGNEFIFQATYEEFGSTKSIELIENGSDIPVVNENRQSQLFWFKNRFFLETTVWVGRLKIG